MKQKLSLIVLHLLLTVFITTSLFLPVYKDPYEQTMRFIEVQSLTSLSLAFVSFAITIRYMIHYKKTYLNQEIKAVHPKYSIGLAILPLLVLLQVVTFSNITKIYQHFQTSFILNQHVFPDGTSIKDFLLYDQAFYMLIVVTVLSFLSGIAHILIYKKSLNSND